METKISKRKKTTPKGKPSAATTPPTAKARFVCEVCGNPCTVTCNDRLYCDECSPPCALGEELFNSLFSPRCLKGLRPGLWSVVLAALWGETETGMLDLYEKRVGTDLSIEEAREYLDNARAVADSLHRVCDVASAVLDHGAKAEIKVRSPAAPRAIVQTVSAAPRRDAAALLRHVADIATGLDSHELSFLVAATVSGENPRAFFNNIVNALADELGDRTSYHLDDSLAESADANKRHDYWWRVKEVRELVGLMAELLDVHIAESRTKHAADMGTLA